jgi:hypothetical protein
MLTLLRVKTYRTRRKRSGSRSRNATSVHLDDALIAPGVHDPIDRFAGQTNELAKVGLAETQRNQDAVAVVKAVLLRQIDEPMR